MIVLCCVAGLLAPLLFGQSEPVCPEQVFVDISECPVALDPNRIAVDPYEQRMCCLGWMFAVAGSPWTWDRWYCDPDGDAMTLTSDTGVLTANADGTYSVTGVSSAPGVTYVTMTLADQPAANQTPITRKGTFAVLSVPKNRSPALCGGQPK